MAQVKKILSRADIKRLRLRGYTVNDNTSGTFADTITASGLTDANGGTDGPMRKIVKGGRWTVRRLRMMGIWA